MPVTTHVNCPCCLCRRPLPHILHVSVPLPDCLGGGTFDFDLIDGFYPADAGSDANGFGAQLRCNFAPNVGNPEVWTLLASTWQWLGGVACSDTITWATVTSWSPFSMTLSGSDWTGCTGAGGDCPEGPFGTITITE